METKPKPIEFTLDEIKTLLNALDYAVDNSFLESCDPEEDPDVIAAGNDIESIRLKVYRSSGE